MNLAAESADREALSSRAGAVAAGNRASAAAGAAILEAGGNAIDAVVASAFTAFVAEPQMCGLGGYGHLAVYLADRHEFYSVDHGIQAPQLATATTFAIDETSPPNYLGAPAVVGRANEIGHAAAGVPGAVAGLAEAHTRWGSLAWQQLLEPAIELAQRGLPVGYDLMAAITIHARDLAQHPAVAAKLMPAGFPLVAGDGFHHGDTLDQSDLAETLRRIADHGAAGLYEGPIARAIDAEFRRGGGLLRAEDLAAYRARVKRETPQRFGGVDYATGDDTVAYEALNILANFDLAKAGPDSAEYYHLVAEALACAFTDNLAYYGDPHAEHRPVTGLASAAFAAARAATLNPIRALPRPVTPLDPWPYDDTNGTGPLEPSVGGAGGTTKTVACDRSGNLAALCTTLETGFGSLVLVPDTGIIMNNAMLDFDPRPGRANSIAPGKFALFGAPTVVAAANGHGLFAAAGSGGYRIEAAVLETMINHLIFAMDPQTAADAPRVFSQGQETVIDDAVPTATSGWLTAAGHQVAALPQKPGVVSLGRVSAVSRHPRSGEIQAGASPTWCTAVATAD